MSYTSPTITASSGTWAQLKSHGLAGQIQAIVGANTFTAGQSAAIRALSTPGKADRHLARAHEAVSSYLHGDPVATATINQELLDIATAHKAILAAIEEVNTLIAVNTGTISTAVNSAGTGLATTRTLP